MLRRNHVIFTDGDNPVNLTVSRSHAHIAPTPSGEYRPFDDGSCSDADLRAGQTLALSPGSPRGTSYSRATSIFFGQALVRFEVGAPTWPPE